MRPTKREIALRALGGERYCEAHRSFYAEASHCARCAAAASPAHLATMLCEHVLLGKPFDLEELLKHSVGTVANFVLEHETQKPRKPRKRPVPRGQKLSRRKHPGKLATWR